MGTSSLKEIRNAEPIDHTHRLPDADRDHVGAGGTDAGKSWRQSGARTGTHVPGPRPHGRPARKSADAVPGRALPDPGSAQQHGIDRGAEEGAGARTAQERPSAIARHSDPRATGQAEADAPRTHGPLAGVQGRPSFPGAEPFAGAEIAAPADLPVDAAADAGTPRRHRPDAGAEARENAADPAEPDDADESDPDAGTAAAAPEQAPPTHASRRREAGSTQRFLISDYAMERAAR